MQVHHNKHLMTNNFVGRIHQKLSKFIHIYFLNFLMELYQIDNSHGKH
jgi:hypothetical protein